jgi:hypothetical protein
MAKLFTAAKAARQISKIAGFESRYYETLKKAKEQSIRPNNTLISIVNNLDRLIKSALHHNESVEKAFEDGYFDKTLDEYKKHSTKENSEETLAEIERKRARDVKDFTPLGLDLEPIHKYYNGLYKEQVLPMQAFETKCRFTFGKKFKALNSFGSEYTKVTTNEYNKDVLVRQYKSAANAILKADSAEKLAKAEKKLSDAAEGLKQMQIQAKKVGTMLEFSKVENKENPAIKTAKKERELATK